MFDRHNPAESVTMLLEYLRAEHHEHDLYRGQVNDYLLLVPSTYREGIVQGSSANPYARFDPSRARQSMRTQHRRRLQYSMMNRLIGDTGFAFGNLLAQQYGLASECVDVTESIDVASYFATRKWPTYSHVGDATQCGVIYRFRGEDSHKPASLTLNSITERMFMGQSEKGYFDSFLKREELLGALDRDRWSDYRSGTESVVSTLPLTLRWRDILQIVRQAKATNPGESGMNLKLSRLLNMDWRSSRIAAQHGGILRPAYYWSARVPEDYGLANTPDEAGVIYGGRSIFLGLTYEDRLTPRIVPSLAIKEALIGVENLRLRPGFEAFFFQHGPTKVTSQYRRLLWPDESEDPIYWQMRAIALATMLNAGLEDESSVDDPVNGLLDRGYRMDNDAYKPRAVYRGQLEDAMEAIGVGGSERDYTNASGALAHLGELRKAAKLAIEAVRLAPNAILAILNLATILDHMKKDVCAQRLIARASKIDPQHPGVLLALAISDIEAGRFNEAAIKLDQAIAHLDYFVHRVPELVLHTQRGLVAGILGDTRRYEQLREMLREYRYPEAPVLDEINRLKSKFRIP